MADDNAGPALAIEGTPFFYDVEGRLRRALRVRLPAPFSGPVEARLTAEGETRTITAQATEGAVTLPGPSACDRPLPVELTLSCAVGAWSGAAVLPPTRHWTLYVAQDKHLDYGWIHPVEKVAERMNALLDYHLDAAERMGLRWNLDTSVWVEEFLRARPSARAERLLAALRAGRFEVGALWLVPFPGLMDTEEWLRSLYYARHLEEAYGIPVRTVSLQEAPSAPWGVATILAGAGLTRVVKGAYDLRNPHLREREAAPLSAWEGPDGSRVLLKWDAYHKTDSWGGYAEAYALWQGPSHAERLRFIEETVARYDRYPGYPVAAILLAGTGFDLYPQTTVVSEFVSWCNAQGWAYPRLVDATWSQFWQEVEKHEAAAPVVRGDGGSAWEEWPAQLAHLNTVYHRARATVLSAQALAALAYALDPATHPARAGALAAAWRGLLQFADHNIGGITEAMADDMRDRKAGYAYTAALEGARALESGLATLAANVSPAPAGERHLLVANPDSWAHSGPVEIMVPEPGPYSLVDLASGATVPCQVDTRGVWPEHYLSFVAADVPPFGVRRYALRPGPGSVALPPATSGITLENRFYRLAVDPGTGGLNSLWDQRGARELVDPHAGFALNQYQQLSAGTLSQPWVESVMVQRGPVASQLIVEAFCPRARLRTIYVLYEGLERLDIVNELTREPSAEPQCHWFLFPLNVAGHQYYYDGPAAILRPGLQAEGGDLLPGSGRTCIAVQSFLAKANADQTLILATPDAHLIQLGAAALHDPLADSDPRHPLALSLVMHNLTRNDHAVNQGGQARFSFRYSIFALRGPFRASAAVRQAREAAQALPAAWVPAGAAGPLDAVRQSLLSLAPGNLVATGLKVAEDGQGWVLRWWECDGEDTEAVVDVSGLGASRAWRCDLLERIQEPLPLERGVVRLPTPARGLRAIRFS